MELDDIDRQLLSGERLLWRSSPVPGALFRPIDAFLIPFSIFWAGFAIFWNGAVWLAPASGSDWFFKLWGLPFLVAGAYITVGRFIHDSAIRRSLTYAVTDRRALIVRRKRSGTSTRSFDLARLPALELQEKGNGLGSILFEHRSIFSANLGFEYWVPALDLSRFDRIENPRHVYDLIQKGSGSVR